MAAGAAETAAVAVEVGSAQQFEELLRLKARFMSLRYKAPCTELESGSYSSRYENIADDLQEQ